MNKYIRIAAILGALAVILGAFGAHALKDNLSPERLAAYKTGVQYQFIHVVVMIIIGSLLDRYSSKNLIRSFYCFLIGVLLFSGSLYLLSTQDLLGIRLSFLGPITPIGGLFFILGWVFLAFSKK